MYLLMDLCNVQFTPFNFSKNTLKHNLTLFNLPIVNYLLIRYRTKVKKAKLFKYSVQYL